MKPTSKEKGQEAPVTGKPAVFLAACSWLLLLASAVTAGEECQNQAEIDICKAGCTATSAVCGALCDFTSGACWVGCQAAFGACDVGCGACDLGCDICCPTLTCNCGNCRNDCDNCHDACDGARAVCEGGCRLDCDDCIFDCRRDCESICRPFKKIGESCAPIFDRCADGLTCWPFLFKCFPSENDDLYSDEDCRKLYSSGVHQGAIDGNVAWTFGTGGASAVGVSETLETGNVYGPDGRYGCFFTVCLGATVDVEVGLFAATGIYISYDDFQGESVAFVEEAGEGIVFATSQIINTSGELIGTADALSIELSLAPITAGVYDCTTIVNTVGIRQPDGSLMPVDNSPPVALCEDRVACADPVECSAAVSIDNGSVDPDNDPMVLVQNPPGPYGLGIRNVTLTVSDLDGASDTCTRSVQVLDCTAPDIVCPASVVVDCEGRDGTFLDPGFAAAFDCSDLTVTEHEPRAFLPGETTLTYTAEDAVGLSSSCEQTITVVDVDTDGDAIVDCVDECPTIPGGRPNGCRRQPVFFDSDADGVFDYEDECPQTPPGVTVDPVGCPVEVPPPPPADADGDGVTDDADLCAGTLTGVAVGPDGCPIDEPPAQPAPDSDGDGVTDDLDLCPDSTASNVDADGCPVDDEPEVEQPAPDGDGAIQLPCGPINLSIILLIFLGLKTLRCLDASGRQSAGS